jgi:putative nucleotidyltransferase with HDIG domain
MSPLPTYPLAFTCPVGRDWRAPSDEDCFNAWDRYAMPGHIRAQSLAVAEIATAIAMRGLDLGYAVHVATVRASALLHDLAKDYTIRWGGSHAQLGAAWAMELTGNPVLAQGIAHHVWWPFPLDVPAFLMPMAVIYADKRVRHTEIVSIEDRFSDLIVRYGHIAQSRENIRANLEQTVELERLLGQHLKVDLHACAFDRGRLVE